MSGSMELNMSKSYKCYSAIFVVSIIFAGCTPLIVSSNSEIVVMDNASIFNAEKAQAIANVVCLSHGKKAIHRPDSLRDGKATFECIK